MADQAKRPRLPFRYLEPTFFAGLFDDPVLYVKVRPTGRGLLFDCGKLHHVAKRVMKSLDAIFVSHAHMDHFMGFDALTRSMHVTPKTVDLFGPPGITTKVEHKLGGYDWNLTEEWWGSWRVHEIEAGKKQTTLFSGPDGFLPAQPASQEQIPGSLWQNDYLKVTAALFDHKIPVLGFRIEERPGFRVDPQRLSARRLHPGRWLEELNRRWAEGSLEGSIRVETFSGDTETVDGNELYEDIRLHRSPPSIGYLTDIGFDAANLQQAVALLSGVDLLICECSFLAADIGQARRACHLCTEDLNQLMESLRPGYLLPMHLSKNNLQKSEQLYAELEPPAGTTLLRLPDYVSPRPLLPRDLPFRINMP